jgi:hypothetical protein
VKASLNRAISVCIRPETRRSNHGQGEAARNGWRPAPVYVARCSDELWLAVICQSSLEIAGSPRNISRYRLMLRKLCGGRALDGCWFATVGIQSNSEYTVFHGTQYAGAKLGGQKGNIPDHRLRSLNLC